MADFFIDIENYLKYRAGLCNGTPVVRQGFMFVCTEMNIKREKGRG